MTKIASCVPYYPFKSVMTAPTILPYVALQPDFANVFADVRDGTILAEDIYLSGYRSESPSVHGKVNVSMSSQGSQELSLEARDGVGLKRFDTHTFSASVPALGIAGATLRVPKQTISFNGEGSSVSVKRISTFDVSPDTNLVASGHLEGEVSLQGTSVAGAAALAMKRQKVHLSTILVSVTMCW
ncbi:hypothetical protein DL93DRAFT_356902 [Clavulina sp. PMI_390]|nr:hypothetical protein DL93DRAFT_356902 [Clavulina sp. PMI_390]